MYFHHSIFHLTFPLFCLGYSTVGSPQSAFDLSYCISHYCLTLLYFSGNKRRKINKKDADWNRRSKTLTANDMILYIENPKDSTRKLLELVNEYSKINEYNICRV